jgi:hypothetical protein
VRADAINTPRATSAPAQIAGRFETCIAHYP